jgi:hypothetical protein
LKENERDLASNQGKEASVKKSADQAFLLASKTHSQVFRFKGLPGQKNMRESVWTYSRGRE